MNLKSDELLDFGDVDITKVSDVHGNNITRVLLAKSKLSQLVYTSENLGLVLVLDGLLDLLDILLQVVLLVTLVEIEGLMHWQVVLILLGLS